MNNNDPRKNTSREHSSAYMLVQKQAEDEGIWFIAQTAAEAYLQQELRRLHATIEREEPEYLSLKEDICTLLDNENRLKQALFSPLPPSKAL